MSTPARSTPLSLLAAWLCTVTGLGCPAAQVKPPEPADCPEGATEAMFRELKVQTDTHLRAVVDINQPPPPDEMLNKTNAYGVYQDGPVIGRISMGTDNLPVGTLLHGHLWTGPGVYDVTGVAPRPAVMGRYTQAVLPDGRKYPVCIVLGDRDGRVPKEEERSRAGAAVIGRELPVSVVERWP